MFLDSKDGDTFRLMESLYSTWLIDGDMCYVINGQVKHWEEMISDSSCVVTHVETVPLEDIIGIVDGVQ